MIRILKVIIFSFTLGYSWVSFAIEIPKQIHDSFVKTKTTYFDQKTKQNVDIYGTGTVVNFKGNSDFSFLVTASHVISGENTEVFKSNGKRIGIKDTFMINKYSDVAILILESYEKSSFYVDGKNSDRIFIKDRFIDENQCFIPNLFLTENEKNSFLLEKNKIFYSRTEGVIDQAVIKPKMSGSPVICGDKLEGIIKAFDELHEKSFFSNIELDSSAYYQYMATKIWKIEDGKNNLKRETADFYEYLDAEWYLADGKLLRSFSFFDGSKYKEFNFKNLISVRKSAGGGVRSDGGGFITNSEVKNNVKQETLFFSQLGLKDQKGRHVYAFFSKNNDFKLTPKGYYLANESSIYVPSIWDKFDSPFGEKDKVTPVYSNIDLSKVIQDRLVVKSNKKYLDVKYSDSCTLYSQKLKANEIDIEIEYHFRGGKKNKKLNLEIQRQGLIDNQIVYMYDRNEEIGVDLTGLFFTDLQTISFQDLLLQDRAGRIINNYNQAYITIKSINEKMKIIPCFLSTVAQRNN